MRTPLFKLCLCCLLPALCPGYASGQNLTVRPVKVVDNTDIGFRTSDSGWNSSVRDKGYFGSDYLWHGAGDGGSRACWSVALDRPGLWNVYARWEMSKPADRATNAPFTVEAADSTRTLRVNMTLPESAAQFPAGKKQCDWNLLGAFQFSDRARVCLSDDADNSVVADAARFEFIAAPGTDEPLPGDLLYSEDFLDTTGWSFEGLGQAYSVDSALTLISESDDTGITAWFRPDIPDSVIVEYSLTLHPRGGSSIALFCARGSGGEDILSALPGRDGYTDEYVNNPSLRCYHFSLHRADNRGVLGGANLSKNPGANLVQHNAVDPCPPSDSLRTYHVRLQKMGALIEVRVDGRRVLVYMDDGGEFRDDPWARPAFQAYVSTPREGFSGLPPLDTVFGRDDSGQATYFGSGKLGFRQVFRGAADYRALRVWRVGQK